MSVWRSIRRRLTGEASGDGLPEGLWRADFGRVDRACERFVQVGGAGHEWRDVLDTVQLVRDKAWSRCVAAAAVDPRPSAEVPGEPESARLHRALTQAAVKVAQAAEAVVMARPSATVADPVDATPVATTPGHTAAAARAAGQALAALVALEPPH